MQTTIIALFALMIIALVVMMFVQGMSRQVDLFSIRNIYLCGFIVYQIVSPMSALRTGSFGTFQIIDPERAGRWMLLFIYIYIAAYLLSYHHIKITRWLAAKFSGREATASDSMLTGLAISLSISALMVRVLGMQAPWLYAIAINVAVALAAVSSGIIGWVWGQRRFNPVVLLIVAVVLSVGVGVSLTGFFSRRPLVSVLGGFAWGAYYRWARNLSPGRLIFAMAPLMIGVAVVLSAYTAIRSHTSITAKERLHEMTKGNIKGGASTLLSGQASGMAGLWILDRYPRDFDYNPLFSLRYIAYWWVPRFIWEDKPLPLGNAIANMARLRGVDRDRITLPPGVVSYAGAEGGLYAVVLYALFFGQFTRFFDELIRLNPGNPFIILPVGSTTGNFLGLARGDIAVFTNLALVAFLSTLLLLYLTSFAFGGARRGSVEAAWPQPG